MDKKLIELKDFSPEELLKWQARLTEMLVYFRDFCESHNLRFYLSMGSLLGAVRHKGFIPWDDDIDVQMPREDYEKLLEIWNKEADISKYVCEYTTADYCANYPMAVIRSVNTTCIYDHSVDLDICQGLKLDIEFLDGVPEGNYDRKINLLCASLLALLKTQRIPTHFPTKIRIAAKILLTILPTKSIRWKLSQICENRIRKYKFSDSKYVRYLGNPVFPKHCFDDVVYMDFDGNRMPVPSGYDEILTRAYGDYMKCPPEEERYPGTNNLVYYDLDRSYKEFKGIYYCVKK